MLSNAYQYGRWNNFWFDKGTKGTYDDWFERIFFGTIRIAAVLPATWNNKYSFATRDLFQKVNECINNLDMTRQANNDNKESMLVYGKWDNRCISALSKNCKKKSFTSLSV